MAKRSHPSVVVYCVRRLAAIAWRTAVAMRLYSTPRSVQATEWTVLALCETALAVVVCGWLMLYFRSLAPLAVAGSIASVILLNTDKSKSLALRWFEPGKLGDLLRRLAPRVIWPLRRAVFGSPRPHLLDAVFDRRLRVALLVRSGIVIATAPLFILLALLGVIWERLIFTSANLIALIITLAQHPIYSFSAFASNWQRHAFCLDLASPIEVLPGASTSPHLSDRRFEYMASLKWLLRPPPVTSLLDLPRERTIDQIGRVFFGCIIPFVILACALVLIVLFGPPLAYRFAMKATSLIYMPLIFVVSARLSEPLSGIGCAEQTRFSARAKIRVIWATCLIAGTVIALLVQLGSARFVGAFVDDLDPAGQFLVNIFVPARGAFLTIKGWHIAGILNSLLMVLLFFYADSAIYRHKHGQWDDAREKNRFQAVHFLQMWLSVYTTVCTLWLVIGFCLDQTIPPIKFQFFPWGR